MQGRPGMSGDEDWRTHNPPVAGSSPTRPTDDHGSELGIRGCCTHYDPFWLQFWLQLTLADQPSSQPHKASVMRSAASWLSAVVTWV